jgi:phage host-nuclease inhibitor protein Gam
MSRTISVTMLRNMSDEELVQYTQSLLPLGDLEHELVKRLAILMNTLEEEVTSETVNSTALINNLQLQINALKERVDQLSA